MPLSQHSPQQHITPFLPALPNENWLKKTTSFKIRVRAACTYTIHTFIHVFLVHSKGHAISMTIMIAMNIIVIWVAYT